MCVLVGDVVSGLGLGGEEQLVVGGCWDGSGGNAINGLTASSNPSSWVRGLSSGWCGAGHRGRLVG